MSQPIASISATASRLRPIHVSSLGSVRAASTDTAPRRRLKFREPQLATFREHLDRANIREREKSKARQEALNDAARDVSAFPQILKSHNKWPLLRDLPTVLQVNIGKFCNLTCRHCHVESGPTKVRENMDFNTVQRCIDLLRASPSIQTVDITGGAPEFNPHFRTLVREARAMGKIVIDRCNLVVLFEKGQEDLAGFLAEQGLTIIASLPCYTPSNTDRQRGKQVFDDSIKAIKRLNEHGFGCSTPSNPTAPGSRLLHLIYNPAGQSLPPSQLQLENDYRTRLWEDHGITFNSLYALTNMPIKRFADTLLQTGEYTSYMHLLANSFNPTTVDGLMCRSTVNIAWDGKIYDCDFNAALEMGTIAPGNTLDIWDIESLEDLKAGPIRTGKHCFGCTAGSGSSCGGTLA